MRLGGLEIGRFVKKTSEVFRYVPNQCEISLVTFADVTLVWGHAFTTGGFPIVLNGEPTTPLIQRNCHTEGIEVIIDIPNLNISGCRGCKHYNENAANTYKQISRSNIQFLINESEKE